MTKKSSVAEVVEIAGPPSKVLGEEEAAAEQLHDEALGAILQRMKGLSDQQVERALIYQRENGGRLGQAFVALGLADPSDIVWALSKQFHYPYAPFAPVLVNEELVVANDPFSEDVEAFRDLRAQLLLGVLSPDRPKAALAVVSSDIGDGKSFVASNLAVTFSQLRGRTLLVDGDMRTPRIQQIFGVDAGVGLATVLAARANDNVILSVPNLPNLFILPVGVAPPNPTELIHRPAFPLLLRELLLKFDYVIFDTPAASHGSDARLIASACGAALVIGRRNHSHTPRMQQLVKQLSKASVRIAGIMMNEH